MNNATEPVGYQRAVYNELREIAADFYQGPWHSLALAPRTNVLVVGASGGGKTFLSHHLASELKLPLLSLEYGNWIVCGASSRGATHTLRLVYNFVQKHSRGIIALDEVDKLGVDGATDWTRSVHLEVFSLLDKRILTGVVENADAFDDQPKLVMTAEQIQERLVRGYLVIGSGAWQHLWTEREAPGFGHQNRCARRLPTYKQLVTCLRPEILNRFRSDILFLPPLGRDDYNALLGEILVRLPEQFRTTMTAAALTTIDEAVETQKGFRWVEELLAVAVRDVRRTRCEPAPSRLPAPGGPRL